jgi:hypothetical protein
MEFMIRREGRELGPYSELELRSAASSPERYREPPATIAGSPEVKPDHDPMDSLERGDYRCRALPHCRPAHRDVRLLARFYDTFCLRPSCLRIAI